MSTQRGLWFIVKPLVAGLLLASSLGAAAAEPVKPIKIRIAYPTGMNGQIPVVMERAKLAEKAGLDAEFAFFQYGPPMMEALASGHVDAVITSLMPVTTFMAQQPNAATVVASLGASSYSLMVGKDSPLKAARDLKGKKIAVSFNSDSHLDLLRYLKSSGLDPKRDVELLNVQPNDLPLTLTEKHADAIVIRQPQVLRLREQSGARVVHTWPFEFVSIMRTQYLKQNPDAIRRYRDALRESVYYMAVNKQQASEWFGAKLRIDPELVRRASTDDPNYRNVTKLADVSIDLTPAVRRKLTDWFDASFEYGMIKSKVASDSGQAFAN